VAHIVNTPAESKALADLTMPSVIIAASGMATGGRVLHHLKNLAPDPRNHILFAGYQAGGTRGAHLVAGAREVKIHGAWVPVNARVSQIDSYSAHADADEILAWLARIRRAPEQVYLCHGEPRPPTGCASASRSASVGRRTFPSTWSRSTFPSEVDGPRRVPLDCGHAGDPLPPAGRLAQGPTGRPGGA